MSRGHRLIAIILFGLALVLVTKAGFWIAENYEYKEVEKQTGYSQKATINTFLAAEYFLKKFDIDVESSDERALLLQPHSSNETIVLNDYGLNLSQSRYEQLKQWLVSGGHLIMTAYDYYDEDKQKSGNKLLDEYGIRLYYNYENKDDEETNDDEKLELNISQYVLPNGEEVSIEFDRYKDLFDAYDEADFYLASDTGTHLLQYRIGEGLLTVTTDNDFLNNLGIAENDHAYLLWWLIQANHTKDSKIWLLYNVEVDSLLVLLWKHAGEACIAFVLLVFVAMWSLRKRIGPLAQEPDNGQRDIGEHLKAMGRFAWREDRAQHALSQSRQLCDKSLQSRYPALKDMSVSQRCQYLAKILDVPEADIEQALYREIKSTNEFISTTFYLQQLRVLQ
ncbi:MAG: hypothetical protein COC05_01655 [Gammaproteobacteria bacterium]|nr:MAG: hypothetical protein COC05_01655 [Gammaproteobacteria bacterium]